MLQVPSQPNTSPMKTAEVPDRSNLMTLLEAASSLDYVQVQGEDADATGQTQQTQTAGEPTSASSPSVAVSYNLLGKKKRPKKISTFPSAKAKVATARPDAKLTLTQLLVASKNGGTSTATLAKKTQKANINKKKITKPPKPTFPQELMWMVTDEANTSIIAFLPCGKQFIILDQEAFLNDVLPKSALAMQTPHSNGVKGKVKMPSFTRRLNRWGFLQCRVQGLENHLVRYCECIELCDLTCMCIYLNDRRDSHCFIISHPFHINSGLCPSQVSPGQARAVQGDQVWVRQHGRQAQGPSTRGPGVRLCPCRCCCPRPG